MQYALEWNYGSAKDPSLNPLMDVLVNIKFNKGQQILPSTIKVFKIPANMEVVDSDSQRSMITTINLQLFQKTPTLKNY